MISIIQPRGEWETSTSNRFNKRMRSFADLVQADSPVVLTLTPCGGVGSGITEINELAKRALDERTECIGIDFSESGYWIRAIYRSNLWYQADGAPAIELPEEDRVFTGTYLGVFHPTDAIDGTESPKLSVLNALVKSSFASLYVGPLALKTLVMEDGHFGHFATGAYSVRSTAGSYYSDRLLDMKVNLPDEAIAALEAASAMSTLSAQFSFVWIACEFIVGNGKSRTEFVSNLSSKINVKLKEVHDVRATVMKSDKRDRELKQGHVDLVLDIIRLFMVRDTDLVGGAVARIEERIDSGGYW